MRKCGQRSNLFLRKVHIRHAQFFRIWLDFSFIPNVGLGELVFEEAFVAVPGLLGRSLRQARKVVRIGYRFTAAALRDFCQQSEIQTFNRLAALKRQLRSDATLILEARNFVTPRTAIVANPALAFFPQIRVIHKRRFGIAGRFLFLERDQIAGDVFRILGRKAQAWHHGHVLYLEFVAVVGTPRVLQVKNKGQALLLIIFGANVFLLEEAIGARAFASIVNPADQIFVVVLLADASEICGKSAALHLVALADGVACQATSCFKQFLAMSRIARRMFG